MRAHATENVLKVHALAVHGRRPQLRRCRGRRQNLVEGAGARHAARVAAGDRVSEALVTLRMNAGSRCHAGPISTRSTLSTLHIGHEQVTQDLQLQFAEIFLINEFATRIGQDPTTLLFALLMSWPAPLSPASCAAHHGRFRELMARRVQADGRPRAGRVAVSAGRRAVAVPGDVRVPFPRPGRRALPRHPSAAAANERRRKRHAGRASQVAQAGSEPFRGDGGRPEDGSPRRRLRRLTRLPVVHAKLPHQIRRRITCSQEAVPEDTGSDACSAMSGYWRSRSVDVALQHI